MLSTKPGPIIAAQLKATVGAVNEPSVVCMKLQLTELLA